MSVPSATEILFKGMGLPMPKSGKHYIKAETRLAKAIDGSTDFDFDGDIDKDDKDGLVTAEEILAYVLKHRDRTREGRVLAKLKSQTAFEDPLEKTPKLKAYVGLLLAKNFPPHYKPTEMEKAILCFRALMAPNTSIFLNGKTYTALTADKGGLGLQYNKDLTLSTRQTFGDLLPDELLQAGQSDRKALCLEYSHLLVGMLRTAGVKADYKIVPGHAYVIASIKGKKYRMDLGTYPQPVKFELTQETPSPDVEGVGGHMVNEALVLKEAGKLGEAEAALKLTDEFLEMNPAADVLLGEVYYLTGRYEAALGAFQDAHAANDVNKKAHEWDIYLGEAETLRRAKRFDEALVKCEEGIKEAPKNPKAWELKARIFYEKKDVAKSAESLAKAIELNPSSDLFFKMGAMLLEKGDVTGGFAYFGTAVALEPASFKLLARIKVAAMEIGKRLLGQGKYAQAAKCFDHVILVFGKDKEAESLKAKALTLL
ncbi:MAG: tetratricopeptide repeat protein [Candidatus Saganbacteria bacterium]|nr:tetratricopeptide repeat protein [Candidatus Saganbacteria bacterium]